MVDNELMERIVALRTEIDAEAASLFASLPDWGKRVRECILIDNLQSDISRAMEPVIADDPTVVPDLQVIQVITEVVLNWLMERTSLPADLIVDAYTQILWATKARVEEDGRLHIFGLVPKKGDRFPADLASIFAAELSK